MKRRPCDAVFILSQGGALVCGRAGLHVVHYDPQNRKRFVCLPGGALVLPAPKGGRS